MSKTKNLGLQVYSDSDFQTTYIIDWMKSENGDAPGSNMELIDEYCGVLSQERREVIATRERDPNKPNYGLGNEADT